MVYEDQHEQALRDRTADLALVRLPRDEADFNRDGIHLIPLYEEQPVVVIAAEHPVAAFDEIALADLADEQLVWGDPPGWADLRASEPLAFPEMTPAEAMEVVASGTGMAIVPMSVARLHHRKDLSQVPVTGVPTTRVGLAWLIERDEEEPIQFFIGVVRGRRAASSRGENDQGASERKQPAKRATPQAKKPTPGRSRRPQRSNPGPSRRRRPKRA